MSDFPVHPAASLLPLMVGTEFDALALDIRAHGLREPVVLHPDGSILDGRNRLRACQRIGIEPTFVTWDGAGSEVAYVMSKNLHRRHLSESQRATLAARIANMRQGERTDLQHSANLPKVSQADAAEMLNVSERSVRAAAKVINEAPADIVAAVDAGELSVHRAAKAVKPSLDRGKRNANRQAQISRRQTHVAMGKVWRAVNDAVFTITSLPDPAEVAVACRRNGSDDLIRRVMPAVEWLTAFQKEWATHDRSSD